MRVLIDHHLPFSLAHGGMQVQVEQTRTALQALGVEAEFLRWWDTGQTGDLIHFFGRPSAAYVELAQAKGMRVVMAELLTATGSRSPSALFWQRTFIRTARQALPESFIGRMAWDAYGRVDVAVAITPWERELMIRLFDAPPERVQVVPNAVEDIFLQPRPSIRGEWLVCTATITPRKRVLELAEAAVAAKTPLWVIGRPYSETDSYFQQFQTLVKQHSKVLRYEGGIQDRVRLAEIYAQARGFVLLSTMETSSLSALEAAACGCPLLLGDLPWARSVYGAEARYLRVTATTAEAGAALREFYEAALKLPAPARPPGWGEVARQLSQLYASVLSTSR